MSRSTSGQGSGGWKDNVIVRFFITLGKIIRGYFLVLGFLITALMIAGVYFVVKEAHQVGKMSTTISQDKPYIMKLTLKGEILDEALSYEDQIFSQFLGRPTGIYLPDLQKELELAAKNQNLKGLLVTIDGLAASGADYDELRAMFMKFKASGKDLQFWTADLGTASFYLATIGSKISMPPVSDISLTGPAFSLTYFGEALRKIGVDIHVIRSGKYKSAFEAFVNNKPSDETLEMYNAIELSMRSHFASQIAAGRGLKNDPVTAVSDWFRKGFYSVGEAKQLGIIDNIEYYKEAVARMEKELKVGVSYKFEVDGEVMPQMKMGDSIALIEAVGEIHMNAVDDKGVITPAKLKKQIDWAYADKNIKAVVLRVSSPGGSAVASDLIWQDIKELAKIKPVVVSMGNVAASGGYYISAAAHKIFAQPNTITGSIGVISMIPKFTPFEEKYGVSFATISNSDRKNIVGMAGAPTEEDTRILGETVDHIYKEFLNRVAEGRKLAVSDVHAIAQGRVWTGSQALQNKLVDELGGMKEAINAAKQLAKLDVNQAFPIVRYVPEDATLFECMKSSNFTECFSHQGARIKAQLTANMMSEELKQLNEVRQFVERVDSEPVQVLWDGYYSSSTKR